MHTIPPNVYCACESVGVAQETRDHNYFCAPLSVMKLAAMYVSMYTEARGSEGMLPQEFFF